MNYVSTIFKDIKTNTIHARKYSKYYVYGDPLNDMMDYIERHTEENTYDSKTMRIYLDACMRTGVKIPDTLMTSILNVFVKCNLRWPIWQLVDSLCPNMVLAIEGNDDLIRYLFPHTNDMVVVSVEILTKFLDESMAYYLADTICARNMHIDHHELPDRLLQWILSFNYITSIKFLMHVMQDIDPCNDIIVNYMCVYALDGNHIVMNDFLNKHMFITDREIANFAEKI